MRVHFSVSKFDNINSHVVSIDIKLRKPIQRSVHLSTLAPADAISAVVTMGYLKVKPFSSIVRTSQFIVELVRQYFRQSMCVSRHEQCIRQWTIQVNDEAESQSSINLNDLGSDQPCFVNGIGKVYRRSAISVNFPLLTKAFVPVWFPMEPFPSLATCSIPKYVTCPHGFSGSLDWTFNLVASTGSVVTSIEYLLLRWLLHSHLLRIVHLTDAQLSSVN